MTPWIVELRDFVSAPDPRFRCHATGWPVSAPEHWIARLRHELAAPASEAELRALREGFEQPFPQDFIDFYSAHNGATLYEDTVVNTAGFRTRGIYVAPISEWSVLGSEYEVWLDSLDEDEYEELVPDWARGAAVFAEVPNSGNYFLVVLSGEKRGQIVYFDHDGFEFDDFALRLPEFFARVTTEPATLLHDLGCYARYADGTTGTQWIPEEYLSGA